MKIHVLTAALAALVVAAQPDLPPPDGTGSLGSTADSPPPSTDSPTSQPVLASSESSGSSGLLGSSGSRVQMDFGSDGSGGSATDGTTGSWYPTPTTSTDAWNIDWTWNGSYTSGGSAGSGSAGSWSGSGSGFDAGYPTYEDDAGIEVAFPGLDGSLEHVVRHNYYFDKSRGFSLSARDGIVPGQCPFESCIHLVFESDYGAMSPFDAFVLDRVESANGPVDLLTDAWDVGGPVPLVLGRLSNETRDRIQGDYAFNWNETRRTTWTLHPINGMDEIDVTLSLKQLYTMLPGYNGTDPASDGPFYSADLTDQVIIRVNGQVASPFAGASAMLPIVVNHTGSQLVDINLTSTLLYDGPGVNGGNEIELVFTLTRRKYGGAMPWFPAKPSPECQACVDDRRPPDAFKECLDDQLAKQHFVFQDLLSPDNDLTMFNIGPFGKACFQAIADGDWINGTNTTAPARMWDGLQWVTVDPPDPVDVEKRKAILQETDDALRCWTETQCAIGGGNLKSDAQVIVLRHEPARTVIDFNQPDFSFYLQLQLNGSTGPDGTFTTPVMGSSSPPDVIAQFIATAVPGSDSLKLDIEVLKYNNSQEIADIMAENQRAMDMYNRAMQWAGSAASTDGGSANDGGSAGDFVSGGSIGDVGGGSIGGSRGSQSSSGGSAAGSVMPQPPTPMPIPPETFSIEIRSLNFTTVVSVLAVFSDDAQVTYNTTDDEIWFEVAPLDVMQFEYVAPPPYVDLSWEEEPAWIKNLRRQLPRFAANDSCGQCMDAYEACLFDIDCAFGVNQYVNTALRPYQLHDKIQMREEPKDMSATYSLDVSEVLRNASAFFPGDSSTIFAHLVTCWATQACNLDFDRSIYYKDIGKMAPARPTVFQYGNANADIFFDQGETLTFTYYGDAYNYTMNGDEYDLQKFLREVVLRNEPPSVRDVSVAIKSKDVSPSGHFALYWQSAMINGLNIFVQRPTSSATFTPGQIEIRAWRERAVDENSGWTALQWPRLDQWLNLFQLVPSSSFPGSYFPGNGNGTFNNGTSDWNNTNPDPNPPVPTPPSSAVCWSCADLLQTCASNPDCFAAVKSWLPSLLPTTSPSLDWDDVYRAYWNLNNDATAAGVSHPYDMVVFPFLSCLAKNGCPVGAGKSTDGAIVMPTTLEFQASRTINIAKGQIFQMYYQSLYIFQTDDATVGLQPYLDLVQYQVGENITFTTNYKDERADITFYGSFNALENLKFLGSDPPYSINEIVYKVWFESHKPVPPSWDFLLGWYGVAPAPPEAVCTQCLPKLEACFADAECWTSVQSSVVPLLQLPITNIATTRYDGQVVFEAMIGMIMRNAIVNQPIATSFTFKSPTSWQTFTEILTCFEAARCDVASMNSALEPPATAHVPSFINTQGGTAFITMYIDTQLRVELNGQTFDFTETASGLTDPLKSFLDSVFAGTSANISVTMAYEEPTNNLYQYNVEFGDAYFGRMPQLMILSPGNVQTPKAPFTSVTDWQIIIEAVGTSPRWDLLVRMLSSPPPTSTPPSNPTDNLLQCPTALAMRSACHTSYSCHTLVGMAIPMLQNQLQTMTPVFNQDAQVYEFDLSWLLVTQLFPAASREMLSPLMDLIRESAKCAAQSFTPSAAQPVFRDLTFSFNRPAHGDVMLDVAGQIFTFPDDSNDPNVDRIHPFEQFVYNNVISAAGSTTVGAMHWFSPLENGVMKHDFEFSRLYVSPPPHLSGVGDDGQPVQSNDAPWKLLFQSPTYALNDAFAPWLAWLTTSAQ